jgi:hypothetical protein
VLAHSRLSRSMVRPSPAAKRNAPIRRSAPFNLLRRSSRYWRRRTIRVIQPHMPARRSQSPKCSDTIPARRCDLDALGGRAAQSRVWAGIHFRSDIVAGSDLAPPSPKG